MTVVHFPEVPQTIDLHAKITPGTHFSFAGNCFDKNFGIALLSSNDYAINILFELENEKLIKAKSMVKGKWTREIQVNGSHMLSYKHQIPVQTISGIKLIEFMEISRLEVDLYQ
ncbi:unnamed protein product [Caenorhabditis bovis]|uniref:Galectin n=1 Tax=Caenorhabditis bovis TaxID=2654633 RepID=A0A8S1E627_9PELO|nr:unnamed protein product [Caenorhabditis bovis]